MRCLTLREPGAQRVNRRREEISSAACVYEVTEGHHRAFRLVCQCVEWATPNRSLRCVVRNDRVLPGGSQRSLLFTGEVRVVYPRRLHEFELALNIALVSEEEQTARVLLPASLTGSQ